MLVVAWSVGVFVGTLVKTRLDWVKIPESSEGTTVGEA
jgi:hypothetical protein